MRAAWQLFHEKGYDSTSVEDVVELAGVTSEIFHRYFQEKDDLEYTLGDLFDRKYADLMVQINPRLSRYETLLYLNRELFHLIETEVPLPLVKHLYMEDIDTKHNLLNKKRFYYSLIPQIIEEGQDKGEFRRSENARELADNYFSLERSIITTGALRTERQPRPQRTAVTADLPEGAAGINFLISLPASYCKAPVRPESEPFPPHLRGSFSRGISQFQEALPQAVQPMQ